jgi:hypothetical protein
MKRDIHALRLVAMAATILAPAIVLAQAPPQTKPPIAPKTEQLEPRACANSDTHSTVGQGGDLQIQHPDGKTLSDKLASSIGVICPPGQIDPEIRAPTPPGGAMPVIPPPGSPGGDPSVQPK